MNKKVELKDVEWRQIQDAPIGYFVSNYGEILVNLANGDEVYLPKHISNKHQYVTIMNRRYYVDYIVAKAFIDNPRAYFRVKHLDGDITNNKITNLAWTNQSIEMVSKYKQNKVKGNCCKCVELDQEYTTTLSASICTGIPVIAINESMKTGKSCFGYHFTAITELKDPICICSSELIDNMTKYESIDDFVKSIIN